MEFHFGIVMDSSWISLPSLSLEAVTGTGAEEWATRLEVKEAVGLRAA